MPTSEVPANVNEPKGPPQTSSQTSHAPAVSVMDGPVPPSAGTDSEDSAPVVRGNRWVDYDTHELLEMISELEDERRWARLREGIWIAILFHLALISAVTWIPRYVFKVPPVIDPIDAIKQRKDLTYLDALTPDAVRKVQPRVTIKPVPEKAPVIDRKTLEAMNRPAPPPPPAPKLAPSPATPPSVQPQPTPPIDHPQLESPRPTSVPSRPSFAMNSSNPADQLREAMKGASRNPGQGTAGTAGSGGLARHPGAGSGGVEVLSDTQGVDFSNWLQRWHWETEHTWDPLIPDEVNPPILKSGAVAIRFKVLPNGRLMDGSLVLEGRSGDVALDRAAWGALIGSNYPPLPRDFHGPYLELRAYFLYNMEPGSR